MNENEKQSGDWKLIVGGILLIIVLFAAIKFIFLGLEQVIPRAPSDVSQSVSASRDVSAAQSGQEAPSFCVHCGKALPESFAWGQFCPYCGEKMEGEG